MTHFTKYKILISVQHGFRAEHSCESQLLLTTKDLVQNFENKIQVDLIVLDFSKAFDVVPHQRLLHKLDHYGIRGPTLLWTQYFLTTQTQKVVVDGSFSDTALVGSGVPQGTVLGPILFLCYINDLPSSVSSDVWLFADDCLFYRPSKSKDDHKKLQEDLTKLERWADIWGMNFNPSKCSVLRVKRPRAKEIASDYQLKGVTLGQVTNSPHLGVSISENLEWGDHIPKIASKANSPLGLLRRNLKGCPSKLKEIAYFQWFGHFWNTLQGDIDKLNKIQRAAARFVTNNKQRKSSATDLIQDLGWTDLQTRRKNFRLTGLYKILN